MKRKKRTSGRKIFTGVIAVVSAAAVTLNYVDWTKVSAADNPDTQTGYETVTEYQEARWIEIDNAVFEKKGTDEEFSYQTPAQINTMLGTEGNGEWQVAEENNYFNWTESSTLTDAGITAWNGKTSTVNSSGTETYTYNDSYQDITSGTEITTPISLTITYTVYNVSTAEELRGVLENVRSSNSAYIKINLTSDINLNGENYVWTPIDLTAGTGILYIEGNGHTIYNMRAYRDGADTGFLGNVGRSLIVKNLDFKSSMVLGNGAYAATLYGSSFQKQTYLVYLYNVHAEDGYVHAIGARAAGLIGYSNFQNTGFMKLCSTEGYYIRGTEHVGGLTGTFSCESTRASKVKYDADFPTNPEAYYTTSTSRCVYLAMAEDCFSVNCEVFSVSDAADSGGIFSCVRALIRNCFTNNIVYGNVNTGAFVGRAINTVWSSSRAGYRDENGRCGISAYFENCYSSGSIEGNEKIGGFVGYVDDSDLGGTGGAPINNPNGNVIFKNCYTTAMVGMDYAGTELGGFVGADRSNALTGEMTAEGIKFSGNLYINCYAAGEVGNILTDTTSQMSSLTDNTAKIGGFIGSMYDVSAVFLNCYYDRQTTAMRERVYGMAETMEGITGVYTEYSEKKKVKGLTYSQDNPTMSVDMGDDNVWTYVDGYYPMLSCFTSEQQVSQKFGTIRNDTTMYDGYDEETIARISAQLARKAEVVKKSSQASVSTVFLDHWDSAMNMDTGALESENDWVVGLDVNKLEQKSYAEKYNEGDDNWWAQDKDGMFWEITYTNLASGTYLFKVQAGSSWAYNFGSNKFNGDNCSLEVPVDCDVTLCFDYVPPVGTTGENTNFRIWAEFYDSDTGAYLSSAELGRNEKADQQNTWSLAGTFAAVFPDSGTTDWASDFTGLDLSYVGTGQGNGNYEVVADLPAGTYSFKIVKDHSWAISYGASGGEDNMSFTLEEDCEVTIIFNENTHLTTIKANPASALTSITTEEEEIDFTGYSLIAPTAITGHNWLDGLEAAEDGEMTDEDGDGIYTVSFTIEGKENFDQIYGYKVIKDANDVGVNHYFELISPAGGSYSAELTFHYDSGNDSVWLTCNNQELINENPEVNFYSVLGSDYLTGHNWDQDEDEELPYASSRMSAQADGTWTITYRDVQAGDHSFKVVADGTFASGIDYGAYDGRNYTFTTTQTADITIDFDPNTGEISVSSWPENAIKKTSYVVSGNEALTGETDGWNEYSTANLMTYNGEYTGTHTKTYEVVTGEQCIFKVVEYGVDDKNYPICFRIDGEEGENYILEIVYNENNATTGYTLYDSAGNDVTEECTADIEWDFWSVIGDEGLTGYNWLGTDNQDQGPASEKGKMEWDEEEGVYTVTFNDVAVNRTIQSFGFKVVANGTWDTGVAYGDSEGNNYVISLASDDVNTCSVTISFNPETCEISVATTPEDCQCEERIDESTLVWYIAGQYTLVSDDAYTTPATVYDTVRDITAGFTFSAGSGVVWDYDSRRNADSGFYSGIEQQQDSGASQNGFCLDYTVEGNNITGTFNEKVITLESESTGGITGYSCSRFMPGKQWVKVTTGGGDTAGSRSLRLLPTAYLEAGNDADIYVMQSESDTRLENISNAVMYRKNSLSDEITFTGLTDNTGRQTIFDRYNIALTAAYAITDQTGLGYYGNYSKQKVQTYDESKIRENTAVSADSQTYFAMSSVFGKSASYDDTVVSSGETSNLVVDELVSQSLIGSSFDTADASGAKTVIKIYKITKADDGTDSYTKVFMERNTSDDSDSTKSVYQKNYLKWTGQMAFDSGDEGEYLVTYYWSLSDGRYLSDSKQVNVYSNVSGITKTVDKEYIEKKATTGGSTETLTYTVTYTNQVNGEFTICDVLPFNGDVRTDTSKAARTSSSVVGDGTAFNLKAVDVSYITEPEEGSSVEINITKKQYTTDTAVRDYIYDDSGSAPGEQVAEKISGDSNITWLDSTGFGSGRAATALLISGVQTGEGTGIITVTYELEVSNAQKADYYVNNAFFTATDTRAADSDGNTIDGFSNAVTTVVVGRELSGYVWIDSDVDGRYDDNEPAVQNVVVTLTKLNEVNGAYESTGKTTVTDKDGYYEFKDIYPTGDYRVEFSSPTGGTVLVWYSGTESREISYNSLNLSKQLSPYQVTDKSQSRNIAQLLGDENIGSSGAVGNVYIINESLPTARQIYRNNNQTHYSYGSIANYYFSRQYQNLGLTEMEVGEDKTSSLTIKKLDSSKGAALAGVKFRLEYRLDEEEEYQVVNYTVDENGEYVFVSPEAAAEAGADAAGEKAGTVTDDTGMLQAEAVATDENGEIRFTGLPIADYRMTEVETLEGYQLLAESVEFSLPYVMSGGQNIDGYVTGSTEEGNYTKSELEEGVTYYYDVTYTVTNSALPKLPLTGISKNLIPLILAGTSFAGATILYAVHLARRKKKCKSKEV